MKLNVIFVLYCWLTFSEPSIFRYRLGILFVKTLLLFPIIGSIESVIPSLSVSVSSTSGIQSPSESSEMFKVRNDTLMLFEVSIPYTERL